MAESEGHWTAVNTKVKLLRAKSMFIQHETSLL
jgi:hypothetical protein